MIASLTFFLILYQKLYYLRLSILAKMPLSPEENTRLYEIINLYANSTPSIVKTIRENLHTKQTYTDDYQFITGFVQGSIITHYLLNLKYQFGKDLKVDEKKQVYDIVFEKIDAITGKMHEPVE